MTTHVYSYATCVDLWSRCRSKDKGKPIDTSFRMRPDDQKAFMFYDYYGSGNTILFKITPDNKFVWFATNEDTYRRSNSLTMNMWKFGLGFRNKGRKMFEITAPNNAKAEVFPGLTIDLISGRFTNAKEPLTQRVIPEVRTQWLRDLKRFKRACRVLARLGALDTLKEQAVQVVNGSHLGLTEKTTLRRQSMDYVGDNVIAELQSGKPSTAWLKHLFVAAIPPWASGEPAIHFVEAFFDRHSVDLRKKYGVFSDE